jgi:hypothetical protein
MIWCRRKVWELIEDLIKQEHNYVYRSIIVLCCMFLVQFHYSQWPRHSRSKHAPSGSQAGASRSHCNAANPSLPLISKSRIETSMFMQAEQMDATQLSCQYACFKPLVSDTCITKTHIRYCSPCNNTVMALLPQECHHRVIGYGISLKGILLRLQG